MQGIVNSAAAAFTLLLILAIGWGLIFAVTSLVERKVRGKDAGPGLWSVFAWVWDNSNVVGIPMLVIGTLYMIWAMNYGPGLGGITMLVLLLMGAAAALVGLAPALRRR
jgi:hypothetical protein